METTEKNGVGAEQAEDAAGGKVVQTIKITVRAPLLVGQAPAINIAASGFQDHIDAIRVLQVVQGQLLEALAGQRDQAIMQAQMAQAAANGFTFPRH